ncbi:hypothetical protein [Natrinema sp. SYSU A 869]|nr:hypothetical protein [Natrinema sp. SYSU A 869]
MSDFPEPTDGEPVDFLKELMRWHGGGDHRETEQAKISIDSVF